MDRVALPRKKREGLVKWQTDDAGVGADQLDHKTAGEPLDGIASCLATPFARGEIGIELGAREPLEAHPRLDNAVAARTFRRDERQRGMHAMGAAREEAQTLRGLVDDFAFRQDAASDTDHSV